MLNFGYARPIIGELETLRQIESIAPTLRGYGAVPKEEPPDFFYDWWFPRELTGSDLSHFGQGGIGTCVAASGKNSIDYRQCYEIVANREAEGLRRVCCHYLYGTGRAYIGKGQLRGKEGSLGIWQAKAVEQYGAIPEDLPGVPPYSERVAQQWGDEGPPREYVSEGQAHTVKAAATPVLTLEDLWRCKGAGYGVTIASMLSVTTTPQSSGFHEETDEGWGHQMYVLGYNRRWKIPYCYILNTWKNVPHGSLRDLETDEVVPPFVLRVRAEVVLGTNRDRGLRAQDSFGYSDIRGWEQKPLRLDVVQRQIERGQRAESALNLYTVT